MKKLCDLSATAVLLFASIVFIVWNVTSVSAMDDICQMHSSADNDSYWYDINLIMEQCLV